MHTIIPLKKSKKEETIINSKDDVEAGEGGLWATNIKFQWDE